jgi:hypothetical protein
VKLYKQTLPFSTTLFSEFDSRVACVAFLLADEELCRYLRWAERYASENRDLLEWDAVDVLNAAEKLNRSHDSELQ